MRVQVESRWLFRRRVALLDVLGFCRAPARRVPLVVTVGINSVTPSFALPGRTNRPVALDDFQNRGTIILCFCPGSSAPNYAMRSYSFHSDCTSFRTTKTRMVNVDDSSPISRRRFTTGRGLPFALIDSRNNGIHDTCKIPTALNLLPNQIACVVSTTNRIHRVFGSRFGPGTRINRTVGILGTL